MPRRVEEHVATPIAIRLLKIGPMNRGPDDRVLGLLPLGDTDTTHATRAYRSPHNLIKM